MKSINSLVKGLALVWITLSTAACVTETTGGFPEPASKETRVQAQLDLARGYIEQQDYNRAKVALEKALKVDARSAEAHVLSGVLFHAEGEEKLAEGHYRQALRLQPDNAQALNNYATFLYAQERYTDAIKPLEKLVKNTSYRARPQAFENLGLTQLKLLQREAAKASFLRALELNFARPRSLLELTDLAFQDQDYEQATLYFDNYRRLSRRQSARSLCLGMQLSNATNNPDQFASFEIALKNLFPEQADQCQVNR